MNRFFSISAMALVLATFLGWTGIVQAKPADKALKGVVVSVTADPKTNAVTAIVVNTGTDATPTNVTVAVDASTTYTLDKKDAKATDIKAGQTVVVSPATGTAKTVKATSPKPAAGAK